MVLVMAENFRSLLCRAAWQRCTEFLAVRRSCADCVFTSERPRSVRFLAVAQPAARSKSIDQNWYVTSAKFGTNVLRSALQCYRPE